MNVALLLSCSSFEGFFGRVQRQSRESYLQSYRNDWSWYYARGLLENSIYPTLYIPSLFEAGKHETELGIPVRFLPLERWYRPFEQIWLKRAFRRSRWSLYADERINALAFMKALHEGLAEDNITHLYIQEYWSGRFDHIVPRVDLPVSGADHGGVPHGVLKWFKRWAFRKAFACYSQTRDECAVVERYGGHSILQPNGCDLSEFYPDPRIRRKKSILTVARLTNKQKRTSDLIMAVAQLPQEWTLDIVGTGPDKQMLQKLAADLDVSPRVTFHDFLSRDEVGKLLRSCGVYAMPSSNEAMALAALEAMACGASVVLSRIRAFEELIEDGANGRLVAVGDVKGLASGIIDAWENKEARGRAASRTIEKRYNSQVLYSRLAESLRGSI
jgi:glycosyltransferase involved in cell wall biosynthesis